MTIDDDRGDDDAEQVDDELPAQAPRDAAAGRRRAGTSRQRAPAGCELRLLLHRTAFRPAD